MRHYLFSASLLFAVAPVAAQVGTPPDQSPFTSIRPGTMFEATVGVIGGNGGPLAAGPRDGQYAALRAQLRANSTVSLGFGIWAATTHRTIIDPTAAVANQRAGEADHELFGAEATVTFNLTGGKTWHGLAPFIGSGIGMTKAGPTNDEFGYEFGTKFYFAPVAGSRLFLGERLYLRLEGRAFTWKLKYPSTWALEPSVDPGTPENPHAVNPTGRTGQYVVAPTLSLGIGVAF